MLRPASSYPLQPLQVKGAGIQSSLATNSSSGSWPPRGTKCHHTSNGTRNRNRRPLDRLLGYSQLETAAHLTVPMLILQGGYAGAVAGGA